MRRFNLHCQVSRGGWRLALALVVVACNKAPPPTPKISVADSLVGTWRITRYTTRTGQDTTVHFPFGAMPLGYLVYDATDHVFFQSERVTAMDSLRGALNASTVNNVSASLVEGFAAYFGTYRVDADNRRVTHFIEGEMVPRGGRFEVATPFHFSADSLVLGNDSSHAWHFVRVRSTISDTSRR